MVKSESRELARRDVTLGYFLPPAQRRPRSRRTIGRRRSGCSPTVRLKQATELRFAPDVCERDRVGIGGLPAACLVSNGWDVVQPLVRPAAVVKLQVRFAELIQVLCAEDQKVIEQLMTESLDQPLYVRLHVGCAVSDLHCLRAIPLQFLVERHGELAVAVMDHVRDGETLGPGLGDGVTSCPQLRPIHPN